MANLYYTLLTNVTGDKDYGSGPYNVTIHAGVTTVAFAISITDDNKLEENENFGLVINPSSLPSSVIVGNPNQTTVTIVDNDGKCICT